MIPVSDQSITRLVRELQGGDDDAARRLWEAYFPRLVLLARGRLRGTPRAAADEEDVALSAFDSFCRRAERGEFPRLEGRGDLWRLLFLLTVRKATNLGKHAGRQRRGGGRVLALTDLAELDLDRALGPEPTPELAAQLAEEYRRRLDGLGDDTLRAVALWKLEGYTNAEIAARLGCVEQTVERKLRSIRILWREGPP